MCVIHKLMSMTTHMLVAVVYFKVVVVFRKAKVKQIRAHTAVAHAVLTFSIKQSIMDLHLPYALVRISICLILRRDHARIQETKKC